MKTLIVTLMSLMVLSITACSSFDSPSTVVKNFYEYVEAGKVNDAYELITKDGKEMLKQYGGGVSALSDLTRKIKNKGGLKAINIENEEITGDTAKVVFVITYGNGTTEKDNEALIKEQSSWKITVSK